MEDRYDEDYSKDKFLILKKGVVIMKLRRSGYIVKKG